MGALSACASEKGNHPSAPVRGTIGWIAGRGEVFRCRVPYAGSSESHVDCSTNIDRSTNICGIRCGSLP